MRFPASFIERVKSHHPLSEVIARRIAIKRHGREFQACCPFHNEKTPSFTINDEKNFYHCFGCGAHGDAITFLIEYDRLSYVDAIKSLAQEGGLALPAPDAQYEARMDRESQLLRVMEAASNWFTAQLNGSIGHEARSYLDMRGINSDAKHTFSIGFAPARRDGLKLAMQQLGFSEQDLLDCGLLIHVEGRPTYDRFRSRVMFPIKRDDGRTIAFGGRLLKPNDRAPKYLNSPETVLFKKNEVLFNMHTVKKHLRDINEIIVVEGYTDVISLHAHGVKGAVAALGTAFNEGHLDQLWRYHNAPIFCFDGDKAGQKAMLRAAEVALPHLTPAKLVRFCGLPSKEDPDSFIRSSGKQAFDSITDRALSMSQVLWNLHIGNREFSTPEKLARSEDRLMQAVESIRNDTLKKRISLSYKNRLWHIGKQQGSRFIAAKNKAGVSHRARGSLSRQLEQREVVLMEQAFALFVHFPGLLRLSDVEHALFEWDWSQTAYRECVAEIANESDRLHVSRGVMEDFMAEHFPVEDIYLKKQYAHHILPPAIYGKDEASGLDRAILMVDKLKCKIEHFLLEQESQQRATQPIQNTDDDRQLLELIKLQQKAHAAVVNTSDDSYI